MHVTGAERCLFLWQLRLPDNSGYFYPAWLEPKTAWVDRDDQLITDLIEVADRLMEARNGELQRAA
jgi:hypothetical protein